MLFAHHRILTHHPEKSGELHDDDEGKGDRAGDRHRLGNGDTLGDDGRNGDTGDDQTPGQFQLGRRIQTTLAGHHADDEGTRIGTGDQEDENQADREEVQQIGTGEVL